MSRLHGCMVALGDNLAQSMLDLHVPGEAVSHWLRSWVKVLDVCEGEDLAWDKGGSYIIRHLSAAKDLVSAAELMRNGS